MQLATDSKDRKWPIKIGVAEYRRVLADLKIDLGLTRYPGPSGQPLTVDLHESPSVLLDVLWSICRFEAQKISENKAGFEDALFGAPLNEFRAAFFEELTLFFRNLNREQDAEAIQNYLEFQTKMLTAQLEQQRRDIEAIGGNSTTSSKSTPESPESKTPDPSLSGN